MVNCFNMKEFELTQGKAAIVDDDIYEKYKWFKFYACKCRNTFYARNNTVGYLHNLVLEKSEFSDVQVTFKNGNGLDCRAENLGYTTHSANTQKTSKHQKRRSIKTQFLGVSSVTYFKARIKHNGKVIHVGIFNSALEAAIAYNAKAIELFGEGAKINKIEPTPALPPDSIA